MGEAGMNTIRRKMMELLREEELDSITLSQLLSIPEKEVFDHLPHLVKSLKAGGEKLHVTPYHCLHCGYSFGDRTRFTRPGRCPRCKNSHIRMATYAIR